MVSRPFVVDRARSQISFLPPGDQIESYPRLTIWLMRKPETEASVRTPPPLALHPRTESPSAKITCVLSSSHNGASCAIPPASHWLELVIASPGRDARDMMTTFRSRGRP